MFGPLGSIQARVAVEKEHKPVRALSVAQPVKAMSAHEQGPFDLMYFVKGAFSGVS